MSRLGCTISKSKVMLKLEVVQFVLRGDDSNQLDCEYSAAIKVTIGKAKSLLLIRVKELSLPAPSRQP